MTRALIGFLWLCAAIALVTALLWLPSLLAG